MMRVLESRACGHDQIESQIDLEYRRQQYRRAADLVRGRADEITWQAFALTMVDGLSISAAAKRLGRSEGVIYAARSRVMRRLVEKASEFDEWESNE